VDGQTPAVRKEVTQLLRLAGDGDSQAAAELLPLVYEELRRLARARMANERGAGAGHTLQPTALVHEVYLRLIGDEEVRWEGRGHFFGAAARAMRRIVVERARHRNRVKRGGGRERVELKEDAALSAEPEPGEVLALDELLDKLEAFDRRKADVVMLRYYAGLSIEETAAALGISATTVKGEWAFARAWLHRELEKAGT
jgi:RNA polymerase sigma factor (TIGR02999 family)